MSEIDNTGELRCPSCGAPRLGHAWDCAKCGAVFEDARPRADEDEALPATDADDPSPPTRTSGSARRLSSARRRGSAKPKPVRQESGGGLTTLREWVQANKAVAVILSFVVYVAVVWSFGAVIIGATDSPGAIKNAYRDLTGRPLPDGFGPTFTAHFVSRRLVVLDRPDQVLLILYRDEDGSSESELVSFAEGTLDVLEVPWEKVKTRSATVSGTTVQVPVFRLWGEGGPHLYLIPIATADGGRGIEAVVGPPETVLDVVQEMVRER